MPRGVRLRGKQVPAQCQSMMTFTELASAPSDPPVPFTNQLRLAVAAYLARFKGVRWPGRGSAAVMVWVRRVAIVRLWATTGASALRSVPCRAS